MRWLVLSALFALCDDGDDDPPAPVIAQPTVMVTASSNPSGAHVTGGGRPLGTTPLQVAVPIAPAQPGQAQSYQFTFAMPGYESQTISATPINNTITVNATLVPIGGAQPVAQPPVAQAPPPVAQPLVAQESPAIRPPPSGELEESDARRQIMRYYATRSEWSGQYVMRRIVRMRMDRASPDRIEAHTGYDYQCILPQCGGASDGYDARIFTFQRSGSGWRVVHMSGHMTARI